jgi:two-component system OmpR family sensor kinase
MFGADRGPWPLRVRGQGEGTLGAQVVHGTVVGAAVLGSDGELRAIAPTLAAPLSQVPLDGRPRSLDLGGKLGEYRVVAAQTPRGDTFVTGLPLGPVRATVYQLAGVIMLVSVAGLLAAALVGAGVIRHTLRPLNRVAATATRVSQLPLDHGEVALAVRVPEVDTDPRTEVGQVGAALNHMLEHVASALRARQASETRVRQFVADASHELRTPLAVIRGYAEVSRRGAHEVPPDVAHALRRVESEAVRMTVLVEDLLLLARLDAGRPVERRHVDLSALVVDALSDAHAAGPDHRWSLDLLEQPVSVNGSPEQLHQLVANLLANARVHTPPGTDVRVSLSTHDGAVGAVVGSRTAVIAVSDNGPGIPPELVPEVFERFVRGDSSRSRAGSSGSTGLGLAIVAGVVAAHGGTVSVDSTRAGTSFTVRLPRC